MVNTCLFRGSSSIVISSEIEILGISKSKSSGVFSRLGDSFSLDNVFSTLGDVFPTLGDVFSTLGDVVSLGDVFSLSDVVSLGDVFSSGEDFLNFFELTGVFCITPGNVFCRTLGEVF